MFAVSLGSDDDIRVDREFKIYRQDSLLGKAVVVQIKDDLSVFKVVEEDPMSEKVRTGDRVVSEF